MLGETNNLIDDLKEQHAKYCAQRDQIQTNFQQLVGAIFACETIIKQHEDNLKKNENLGALADVETNSEDEKQITKE